jgi:antitoxin component YwqK of YwqJK toxin-antitoxin module
MANTFVRTRQWKGLRYSAWEVRRLGFLNHRMYGYMFAVLSNYREEEDKLWQKYFCTDVDNFHKQASTFLEEQMEEGDEGAAAGIYIKEEDVFFEKYFYEGGGIQLIAHLKDNQYEGLSIFYHQNGILYSERIYKNGIPFTVLSTCNRFDEEVEKGSLFEGNGTLYLYKPDGNLDEIETYKDGIKINVEKVQ